MPPPLLSLQDIHLTLGGSSPLLSGAELAVGAGERICLVGRNGSGKSTLLKVAAGLLTTFDGPRFMQPGATVRYLHQEPEFGDAQTVLAYVEAGLGPGDDPYRAPRPSSNRSASPATNTLASSPAASPAAPPWSVRWPQHPTSSSSTSPPTTSTSPPSSGSNPSSPPPAPASCSSATTAACSKASRAASSGWTAAAPAAWTAASPPSSSGATKSSRQEERDQHKLARQIAREEDWMRYGVTARRKRNVRRVAELAGLRASKRDHVGPTGGVRMAASEGEGSGKLVAVAEDVFKSYPLPDGGTLPVIRDFSTRIIRGDRVGIVGPNGAGKSTLLKLLTGVIQPDRGRIKLGTNLSAVTLDQTRDSLNPATTLSETLTGGAGDQVEVAGQKRHVIGYMKDFLFRPEQARTPVGVLSGGERGRLMLAVALARPSNLMILDEPTNDLDLETLDLLQEMLSDYQGTVLLVSHDRDFLDRTVTSTIGFEGEQRWQEYAGGYSDMLAQRGTPILVRTEPRKRASTTSDTSKPPAPKKLSFKQMHELQQLPDAIAKLQSDIVRYQRVLTDANLYTRDRKKFDTTTSALSQAETELARSEERWLELEMLKAQ